MSTRASTPSVSPVWLIAAAVLTLAMTVLLAIAIGHQRDQTRPRGEGTLFVEEGRIAADLFDAFRPNQSVREIRNELTIEAVARVDADGTYLESSSQTLVGQTESDPYLRALLESGRFGAIATRLDFPLILDGITEWHVGDVVYRVLQPLDDGTALILHYDMSELLARRASLTGIAPLAAQLIAAAGLLFLMVVSLLGGRAVARRRLESSHREREILTAHSAELEERNRALDDARREAERALALAEETNRIRSDFVMMINHELRTPLTSLVTGTDLLQTGVLDGTEEHQILDDMARDGRRLLGLIGSVLAVARIENRGLDYRLRPTRVSEILEAVASSTGAASVGEYEDRVVLTDESGLVQLLISLAENARTHGANNVRVTVSPDPLDRIDYLVGEDPVAPLYFRIQDDGPGIDPEFLPRAFEKFEKSSFSSGTGLGLYVARLMAEAIEAAIAVRTGPDGTTMCVSVPLAAAVVESVA